MELTELPNVSNVGCNLKSEQARALCSFYLGSSWHDCPPDEFLFRQLTGGLSNHLYVCQLADSRPLQGNEPKKVLIRVFGEIIRQSVESQVLDSVIFALLSEKDIGPRLYGVFHGGRIEQFIADAIPLKTDELQLPAIYRIVAKKFAEFHALDNMPLVKKPTFCFSLMNKWIDVLKDDKVLSISPSNSNFNQSTFYDFASKCHLYEEIDWIKKIFETCNYPVVFCHNDLQENNILSVGPVNLQDLHLKLIDFEYCSYNYRGFDIGNFFNEFCFNYCVDIWPYFKFNSSSYPNRKIREEFWSVYLSSRKQPMALTFNGTVDQMDNLIIESVHGSLLSHLFWAVWAFLQASMSDILFDYKEYAFARMQHYNLLKQTYFLN